MQQTRLGKVATRMVMRMVLSSFMPGRIAKPMPNYNPPWGRTRLAALLQRVQVPSR